MRMPVMVGVLMAVALAGCGKKVAKNTEPDSAPPAPPAPAPVVTTGTNPVAPNQAGNLTVTSGQGAIQSPRMAAARTVNEVQMKQLHLTMFQEWQLDNRVPDAAAVMKEARQNSQLFPLLKEEVVILTGTPRGDGVWAYTQYPQRAGNHYVVVQSGVTDMSPDELRKRLEQQGSPAKLAR